MAAHGDGLISDIYIIGHVLSRHLLGLLSSILIYNHLMPATSSQPLSAVGRIQHPPSLSFSLQALFLAPTSKDTGPDPRSGLRPASAYVFVAPKAYVSPMHTSPHYCYYMSRHSLGCLLSLLPHILHVRSSLPVTYIRPHRAYKSAIRYRPSSNAACVRAGCTCSTRRF
jgi:hypothetical protein